MREARRLSKLRRRFRVWELPAKRTRQAMLPNDFVGHSVERAGFPIDFLVILRATGKHRLPVFFTRGAIGPRPTRECGDQWRRS